MRLWRDTRDAVVRRVRRALTYLRPAYRASMNRQMHEAGRFVGVTWKSNVEDFERLIPESARQVVLDYGCGPRGGIAERYGERAISHDPYVKQFSQLPWDRHFDAVFSSDVLEHMTPAEVDQLCDRIRQSSATSAYLIVSTRAAKKTLPNGMNAHLTVQPAHWWRHRLQMGLGEDFELLAAKADLVIENAAFCFVRRQHQSAAA